VIAVLSASLLLGAAGAWARPDLQRRGSAQAARHRDRPTCSVPKLSGLVVAAARRRVAKAGCRLRLLGAPVERDTVQTIARQRPRAGQRRRVATAWVNPLCAGSADAGPPSGEPLAKPGPTELVSGLYLVGGPLRLRSVPRCASIVGTPGAGTITVSDPATGAIVATDTVATGQLAKIPLPPGTYTVVGTYANAYTGDQHIESLPRTVTIPPGETIRQDVTRGVR
jgi:hypothetical protein